MVFIVLTGVSGLNGLAAKPIYASETTGVTQGEQGFAMIHAQLNEVKLQRAKVKVMKPEHVQIMF